MRAEGIAFRHAMRAEGIAFRHAMRAEGLATRLVIQSNTMDYLLPILGDFTARSALAEPEQWPRFLRMFARMGRARLRVTAQLESDGQVAGRLTGEFVALSMATPER